jgi:hypothetical protein
MRASEAMRVLSQLQVALPRRFTYCGMSLLRYNTPTAVSLSHSERA